MAVLLPEYDFPPIPVSNGRITHKVNATVVSRVVWQQLNIHEGERSKCDCWRSGMGTHIVNSVSVH